MNVFGVDGAPGGWAAIACKEGEMSIRRIARLGDIFEETPFPDVVAVDIPIGLLDAYEIGGRACDREARRVLGKRAGSVFTPPVGAVLNAETYEEACALSRESSRHEKALSRQTWGIVSKIKEVDDLLRLNPHLRPLVREVHPEICFRELVGRPMTFAKSKAEGRAERRDALACVFNVQAIMSRGQKEKLPVEDTLDALVVCWSAMRIARGEARRIVSGEKTIWV